MPRDAAAAFGLVMMMIGALGGFAAAQTPGEPEVPAVDPWTRDHWTAWNDIGIDAGPSSMGWEGATAVTEGLFSVTVWCSRMRGVAGYEFSYDPALMAGDPANYTVATLSVGGHLFNLPVTYAVEKYQIPGVPDERPWPDQEEFLKLVALGRLIELVSLADPASGMTVFFGSKLPTRGCGAGLVRVLASCKLDVPAPEEFCAAAFCPGEAPVLEYLTGLMDRAPDGMFPRPKDDIFRDVRAAFAATGDEGIFALTEGLCFAPGGIMGR